MDLKAKRLHRYARRLYPDLDWVYDYREIRDLLVCRDKFKVPYHPMVVPNWDTTARYNGKAIILHNSTPEAFRQHLRDVLSQVEDEPAEQRIIFIKSWNEWAEGNYLEPDQRHGCAYLDVVRQELIQQKANGELHRECCVR